MIPNNPLDRHSRAGGNPDDLIISREAGQHRILAVPRNSPQAARFDRFAGYVSLLDSRLRGNDAVCANELLGIIQRSIKIQDSGSRISPRCFQRGFSLISAIFLLVVIAALGMFAVTLSTNQQQSATLDLLGSRAYQASRAGIEWGAYQVITPGAISCNTLAVPAHNNVALTEPSLQNFTVTVDCGSTAASEAGATVTMYQLTSTATQGTVATPNYVERQMTATIAK